MEGLQTSWLKAKSNICFFLYDIFPAGKWLFTKNKKGTANIDGCPLVV
jgi:hypothetical protein